MDFPSAAVREDLAGTLVRMRAVLAGSQDETPGQRRLHVPEAIRKLLPPGATEELRAAAVLVPIVLHPGNPTVLLTQRAETLRQHTGQISFPGGGRDAGDASFAATALRESQEEVGLDPATVEVLGYLDDHPTLTGYRITPVVALVMPPLHLQPDPNEVAAVMELPFADVLDRGCFEFHTLSRGGVSLEMPELKLGSHRIWGATAVILWHLHQELSAEPRR